MPQFFIDKKFEIGSEVAIRGSDAKHIATVLRLRPGDWIVLSDGSGNSFKAEIIAASDRNVTAKIKSLRAARTRSNLTLAIAVIKHDRIETIIQKAIELGIARIIPFHSERTVPKLVSDLTDRKLERWKRIAIEAAKQSGLPFRPVIEPPLPFSEIVDMMSDFQTKILFWEGETEHDLASCKDVLTMDGQKLIIIGPEGGFSDEEVTKAKSSGAMTVSLGQQILRVETAAIAALSICQYEAGGFGR